MNGSGGKSHKETCVCVCVCVFACVCADSIIVEAGPLLSWTSPRQYIITIKEETINIWPK